MLGFLEGKASDRKLWLFACACCRRIWSLLTDPRIRAGVGVAERFADGLARKEELEHALEDAWTINKGLDEPMTCGIVLVTGGNRIRASQAAWGTAMAASGSVSRHQVQRSYAGQIASVAWNIALAEAQGDPSQVGYWNHLVNRRGFIDGFDRDVVGEQAAQAALLRDLFGPLPFRPVDVDPLWLAANEATIPRLAQTIYEERQFEILPVLADALEDAGCADVALLDHCRSQGEHVRGCWVVDLVRSAPDDGIAPRFPCR
jgi:hypothetical protein